MRTVLADGFGGRCDTRAIDETTQRAELRCGFDGLSAVVFAADVAFDEDAAEFLRERLASRLIQVGEHHLAAVFDENARGGGAKARRTAGDQECIVTNLHVFSFATVIQLCLDRISFRWSIVAAMLRRGKRRMSGRRFAQGVGWTEGKL